MSRTKMSSRAVAVAGHEVAGLRGEDDEAPVGRDVGREGAAVGLAAVGGDADAADRAARPSARRCR